VNSKLKGKFQTSKNSNFSNKYEEKQAENPPKNCNLEEEISNKKQEI